MLTQILLGLFMTALTIALGSIAIVIGAEPLRRNEDRLIGDNHLFHQILAVTLIASSLVIAMLMIMLLWALLLLGIGF